MPPSKKNKDSRPNPGTESRPSSFFRSVLKKMKPSVLKPSGSKPNTDSKSSPCVKVCGAILRIIGALAGVSTESMEKEMSGNENIRVFCGILAKWIKKLKIPQVMKGSVDNLCNELSRLATEDVCNVEDARWTVTNCLQMFLLENLVTGSISLNEFVNIEKHLSDIQDKAQEDVLRQAVRDLVPRAVAAYNDYTAKSQSRTSCFEGTRVALLKEISKWLAESESNVYVLFGLAGIGKSTIAQTISEKADQICLLGASFFFSRDEADRRTAKMFFTTIAFQLCIYDPEFAAAIESVMLTEKGKGATTKLPIEQLETLILEPLRKLAPRKVVIVVDALDECDDDDVPTILVGLNKLVQSLPSFKVFLTTRPQGPQQHPLLQTSERSHKIFCLHDIEEKIVDGDIELYLRHNLSSKEVKACLPNLRNMWAATDDEIASLVRGAGRLFIIASTAVLFILDKTSTPASRMKTLLTALDQGRMPLNKLNDFYTVILRNAVPKDCEPDTAKIYQTVIGAIVLLHQPLSVSKLAELVDVEVDEITTVLGNLQAVILVGNNDIPVVYHKSFPDYIQDSARCQDDDLRIDPTFHHTRMAIHCLRLLNQRLKQNILELGDPALFMDNDKALKTQGLTESDVQEKIPSALRYACSYFGNHFQYAGEDADLVQELERFFDERFLNWLEALSWIRKLDTAHSNILMVQKQLKPTASDLCQLVTDGQRFVWKFYNLIKRSALHTYHSALPLTPTETSLC